MNQTKLRLMGISGILGGILLFIGDMLFYFDRSSTDLLQNMAHASDSRIMVSGFFALLATWLYLIGIVPVYMAFQSSKKIIRNTVTICFIGIVTIYGVVHAAYVAIATSAKIAVENNLDIQKTVLLASQTNDLLRVLGFPLFGVLSILFINQVWQRKTRYPRWMVFFFPLLLYIINTIFSTFYTGTLSVIGTLIVDGGFLNLILIIFFTASTISLWNVKVKTNAN